MSQITTPPLQLASDVSAEDLIFRKIALRLVPFLFLCYLAAYLDRVNVGFAKLQMQKELAFSETVYGFGAGIFFLGYVLFEVPSNIILHKVGARLWLARVMVTWAIISAATAFVSTPTAFYVMQLLAWGGRSWLHPWGVVLPDLLVSCFATRPHHGLVSNGNPHGQHFRWSLVGLDPERGFRSSWGWRLAVAVLN